MRPFFHLVLMMCLLLGTAASTAHGVEHSNNGFEQCLLCASHATAKTAITHTGVVPLDLGRPGSLAPALAYHRQASLSTCLPQPRAPPAPA